jgi:AcrR family transcriptional regulator
MAQPRSAYDEKLESILRSAAVIFAEKGYHQASIRDIARATRVSLSGLYYYFQSKEELLFLIQDHALGMLVGNLERRLAGVTDPEQKLRVLMENHLGYFLENMPEMKLLSREADSLTGEFRERAQAQKRRLTEIASEILAELRPGGELQPRVSVFALFGMMNWIYTWYRPERDLPAEQLAAEMSRLFLHGYLGSPDMAARGEPMPEECPALPAARRDHERKEW